jgi:hypothetical protein
MVPAGFQYLTETYIAVQRIDKFLSMPEPPPPVHMRAKPAAATAAGTAADAVQSSSKTAAASRLSTDAEAAAAGGSKGSGLLSHIRRKSTEQQQQQQEGRQVPAGSAAAEGDVVMCRHPDGYVELGGADYDWNTNVEEMTVQVGQSEMELYGVCVLTSLHVVLLGRGARSSPFQGNGGSALAGIASACPRQHACLAECLGTYCLTNYDWNTNVEEMAAQVRQMRCAVCACCIMYILCVTCLRKQLQSVQQGTFPRERNCLHRCSRWFVQYTVCSFCTSLQ